MRAFVLAVAFVLACAVQARANIAVSQVRAATTTSTTSGTQNCNYLSNTGTADGLLNIGSAFDISTGWTGASPAVTQIQNEGSGSVDLNSGYVNTTGSALSASTCAVWTADASGQNIVGVSYDAVGQASGAAFINTKIQGTGSNAGFTTSTLTPTVNGCAIVLVVSIAVTAAPSSVSFTASAGGTFPAATLTSETLDAIGKQTLAYAYFVEGTATALTVTVAITGGTLTGTPSYQMFALAPASYSTGAPPCLFALTPCFPVNP